MINILFLLYYSLCNLESEENVYKFIEHLVQTKRLSTSNCDAGDDELVYVIFISNDARQVPIWYQKSSIQNVSEPVVWDYHVILIEKYKNKSFVYDFDSLLKFPVPFSDYLNAALPDLPNIKDKYKRFYRVINYKSFLANFASDRSHMIKDGRYLSEPPSYKCIETKGLI
jgi:protein N-terminal glutamine amidohydrolase